MALMVATIGLWVAATTPGQTSAAPPAQRFAAAQALFDDARRIAQQDGADSVDARRRFREAAIAFAALARDGVASANLCVNAGNAYHFAGDNPRALLWYRRALSLANTPEIRNGLASLRRVCGAELWPPPQPSIARVLMFWHYDVSRRARQIILLIVYPLGCALGIAAVLGWRRRLCARAAAVLLLVGATLGVSDIISASGPAERWAVVVDEARGYAGDGESYTVVLDRIRPGQEVKVVESRLNWVKVALPGGAHCWLRADLCEPVDD